MVNLELKVLLALPDNQDQMEDQAESAKWDHRVQPVFKDKGEKMDHLDHRVNQVNQDQ